MSTGTEIKRISNPDKLLISKTSSMSSNLFADFIFILDISFPRINEFGKSLLISIEKDPPIKPRPIIPIFMLIF